MKQKALVLFVVIISCFCLSFISGVYAQDEESSDTGGETNWKQELRSDKQGLREDRQQIKQNATEARTEEEQMRQKIREAFEAGDMETANSLREQLKTIHQENIQQMQQDMQGLKESRQDFKQDVKDARQEGDLPPRRDNDNNPPGPQGGQGTNWENRPGPQGGPGASPDRKKDFRDNKREDIQDQGLHKGEGRGVKDHGQGIGAGKGQGGMNRPSSVGPRPGGMGGGKRR